MATQSTKGLINLAGPQHITVHSYNDRTIEAEIGIAIGSVLLYIESANAVEYLYRTIARANITDLPVFGDRRHTAAIEDVSQLAMSLRVRGVPPAAALLIRGSGEQESYVRFSIGDDRLVYAIRNQRALIDVRAGFADTLRMSRDVFLAPAVLPAPRTELRLA